MTEQILEALGQLDPTDDSQWTDTGDPKVSAIHTLTLDKSITRQDIVDADPEFNRNTLLGKSDEEDIDDAQADADEAKEPPQPDPDVIAEPQEFATGEVMEEGDEASGTGEPLPPVEASDTSMAEPDDAPDDDFAVEHDKWIRRREEWDAACNNALQLRDLAQEDLENIQKGREKFLAEFERKKPRVTQAEAIKQFQESQLRQRAGRRQMMIDASQRAGIDPKLLGTGSPLDDSMRREVPRPRPAARAVAPE